MTVTRLNTIEYGPTGDTIVLGAGTSYDLHDLHSIEKSYESIAFGAIVVIVAASEAALLALASPLEAAFRKPHGDLTVTLNGSTFFAGTQAGNTLLNATPSIQLLDSHRTNVSRAYAISVEGVLPADEAGEGGKRSASVQIVTDDSGIRTLTVSAEYTALAGNSALAQAQADFSTYVSDTQTALGGTWDATAGQELTYDKENKIASATTTYRELIFNQWAPGLDNASLVGIQYQISVIRESAPNLTGTTARPLTSAEVTFSSNVDKDATQDLDSLVTATVIPYLKAILQSGSDVEGTPITTSKIYRLDPVNNVVLGRVTFLIKGETLLVQVRQTADYPRSNGINLVPVMSGEEFDYDRWDGPPMQTCTIELNAVALLGGQAQAQTLVERAVAAVVRQGYVELGRPVDLFEQFTRKTRGGERLDFVAIRVVVQLQRGSANGGGGSGGKGLPGDAGTSRRDGGAPARANEGINRA